MANDSVLMMSRARVVRSLRRMAYQIAEANKTGNPPVLLGIDTRGYITAGLMADLLADIYGDGVRSVQLPVRGAQDAAKALGDDFSKENFVIVVDDVVFSGGTMFKALNMVVTQTGVDEIHTAVLVDRGHRKFPVEAQFSGIRIPTKLDEHVNVVIDNDTIEQVVLERNGAANKRT